MEMEQFTEIIIGCAFRVANALGMGFLEKIYENALVHELKKSGLRVAQQYPIRVSYDGIIVGDYIADILVEELILVEAKAVRNLESAHKAQCLNYLKATNLPLCLLINFGTSRIQVKRIVNVMPYPPLSGSYLRSSVSKKQ